MNKGILNAIVAYALWGILPVYWKLLQPIPALQVIGHRIGWSFIFLTVYMVATGQWKRFRSTALTPGMLSVYSVAAVLLSVNWLVYVWGVNAGFIVETSLGYFINPLLSVLLGSIFLRERLRRAQWIPVALAAAGVVYLTFSYGRLPWIALTLAFTFGFYGLVKKLAPLGSLYGLTLETGIAAPVALVYLVVVGFAGTGAFPHDGARHGVLLMGAGVVTLIPLLMFSSAAKQIPLTVLGILQYIAPTLQLLIGVVIYREPFDRSRVIGFGLVWCALAIFWLENYLARRALVSRP